MGFAKFYFLAFIIGPLIFYIAYRLQRDAFESSEKSVERLKKFKAKINKPPPQYPDSDDIERTARSYQSFIWETLQKIRTPDDIDSKQHFKIALDISKIQISEQLKKEHGYEMIIALQWDFEITHIDEESFNVILKFNDEPETFTIPYEYIMSFSDPSADFEIKNPDYF